MGNRAELSAPRPCTEVPALGAWVRLVLAKPDADAHRNDHRVFVSIF